MTYTLDKLNELSSGDQDFIESIVAVFIEETPDDLQNLQTSIQQKNFEQVYQFAHKIKPNVDLLGMDNTTQSLLQIEREARGDKNLSVITTLFPAVQEAISKVLTELKADFGL